MIATLHALATGTGRETGCIIIFTPSDARPAHTGRKIATGIWSIVMMWHTSSSKSSSTSPGPTMFLSSTTRVGVPLMATPVRCLFSGWLPPAAAACKSRSHLSHTGAMHDMLAIRLSCGKHWINMPGRRLVDTAVLCFCSMPLDIACLSTITAPASFAVIVCHDRRQPAWAGAYGSSSRSSLICIDDNTCASTTIALCYQGGRHSLAPSAQSLQHMPLQRCVSADKLLSSVQSLAQEG